MPSSTRPSANQPAPVNAARRTRPRSSSRPPPSAQDYVDKLLDDLKNANTELNKSNAERDRYRFLSDQADRKLSESYAAKEAIRAEMQSLREDADKLRRRVQQLERDNADLVQRNCEWEQQYALLDKTYSELEAKCEAIPASAPPSPVSHRTPPSTKLPKRPKAPPHRRMHVKDPPPPSLASGNISAEKLEKEQRDRLSKRFDEKRPPPAASGARSARRGSFIENWGPGPGPGPGPAAMLKGPPPLVPMRVLAGVAHAGRAQPPAVPPPAPLPAPDPPSPAMYRIVPAYSEEKREDGNYFPYPLSR